MIPLGALGAFPDSLTVPVKRRGPARSESLCPEDSQDDEGYHRDELHDYEGCSDCVGAIALRAGTFWND